ncbi:hypothetical protein NLI96_g3873 [Meripilus lineatus]|uniref:Prefoldin subunit 3 n=1 Tax=Meripilus lineatus TaxID=2056292 RepID=A0AAD5YKF9_9APHY|nr:hypothetical protein NLI96_g3873 [Physisporinus lineatus]
MTSTAVEMPEKNPRGIPRAPFITNVEEYLGSDPNPEIALREFQAALSKYRYMDHNLSQRRRTLEEKIPDIKKTLNMVEFLQERREGKRKASSEDGLSDDDDLEDEVTETQEKKPIKTTFELNDTLWAEAELDETDTVYLWLGANVMLSYKIPAAIALLQSKLEATEASLATIVEDLEYLREQITIMEVNTARVYNWDVKWRRELREREAKSSGS